MIDSPPAAHTVGTISIRRKPKRNPAIASRSSTRRRCFRTRPWHCYEEARRPGNSRRQTELVRQANEQIRLRGEKLRAFTDCVNQAMRQTGPPSDQFASSGESAPTDQVQTQPAPSPRPNRSGGKSMKRMPEKPPTPPHNAPQPVALDKAVDDCFAKFLPNYSIPDGVCSARTNFSSNRQTSLNNRSMFQQSPPNGRSISMRPSMGYGRTGSSCGIISSDG